MKASHPAPAQVMAWTIVGYAYKADTYCPEHILMQLGVGITSVRGTEATLDLVADARGIDRLNEHSYDSDEFPKVIFASDMDERGECATCGEVI